MATGSQLMTTYYAKRIMGDNAAADAEYALLQTGVHIDVDTWILHRENRTNLYGIKYKYDNTETSNVNNGHDKIELYGGYQNNNTDIATAWVQLDTGDIHTIGSFNGDHLNLIGTGNTVLGYDEDNTAPYIELRNSDNTKNIRISLATTSNKNGITINQQDDIQSFLSVHGYLWLYSPDVDMTDANNGISSGSIIEQIQAIDSNGYDFGLVQFNADSSGAISNLVCARNIVDNTNKYIGIYSVLNKDGTGNIYLRNNAATAQDAIACEFGSTENTITISGKTVIEYNNQWLTPARIQLNRYDTTAYTDRACVGVTNGNLHLDAYNTSGIYLNHYSSDGNIYFNGSTYYINGGNYNGNSATATKWAAAQKVYVTLGTASTTTTIQGGSTSAETIGVDGTLGVGNGGTGKASWTKGGILYASATNTLAQIADGSADKVLRATASATYSWLSYTSSSTASTLVYRDASKNFSAGTITATLSGNASTATTLKTAREIYVALGTTRNTNSKVTFDGSADKAIHVSGTLPIARGGTGKTSAADAWTALGGGASGKHADSYFALAGHTHSYLPLSGGTMTGKLTLLANQYGGPSGTHGLNCNNSDICSVNGIFTADAAETTSEGLNFFRSASTWDSMTANGGTFYFMANHAFNANYSTTATANIRASKVYGAVWNDYAEYRECDLLSPGTCVQENDNGYLTISDKRLLAGASIISDTFGYAEGETEKAQTPIAVSGRVLAYTYLPREMYHAGMAVCSAPGGTVDIMTRNEIRDYPDAIIGIVSEIPDYETWGSGNIEVNGRIWIKVK